MQNFANFALEKILSLITTSALLYSFTKLHMYKITDLHAREVLDSRGNPTIEVDLEVTSDK